MLKPRPCIESLSPYRTPILSREGLCLDLNENATGCSPRVLARLHTLTAKEVAHYPAREEGERLVAEYLNIPPEQLLLTNGVDDALALLFSAYLTIGDELLFADPTFVMYPMLGQACGATVVRLKSGENLELPVDGFLRHISPRTRVIAIANPNNPTGLVAPRASLLRIVQFATNAAVLIDEAYFEFCGQTLMGDLVSYPNLFVTRTFSKSLWPRRSPPRRSHRRRRPDRLHPAFLPAVQRSQILDPSGLLRRRLGQRHLRVCRANEAWLPANRNAVQLILTAGNAFRPTAT